MLTCSDVHYAYAGTPVLRGVDLTVAGGEVVALLGPSGSGKSTLLYCLSGVLVPTQGSIELAGERLEELDDDARTRLRGRSCGFVLQFGRLVGELTAVENAAFPLRLLGSSRRTAEAQARAALADVGVDHLADRATASLSGGEQQRVAVARALVHRPAVVFADEPTGALDTENGERVLERLTGMARDRGSAVVLVTHDEGLALRADRVVRMRDGLVESETRVETGNQPRPAGVQR